jgi:hypothetical protein
MEYVFVNDWFIYWFATLTLVCYSVIAWLLITSGVFISAIVYDIVKQITLKWRKK